MDCMIFHYRCRKGKILSLTLAARNALAPRGYTVTYCNVEPTRNQVLYQFSYQVFQNGRSLGKPFVAKKIVTNENALELDSTESR